RLQPRRRRARFRPAFQAPADQSLPGAGTVATGPPEAADQHRAWSSRRRRRDAARMSDVQGEVLSVRRAGVLLPASALCQQGAGALGAPAHRFIDWLADAGFSVWQLLPLVPVDQSGSPYWARADRAGNPAFID